MAKAQKETHTLKVVLSNKEHEAKEKELREAFAALDLSKEDLDNKTQEYKAAKEAHSEIELKVKTLSREVAEGAKDADVECYWHLETDGLMHLYRKDTSEPVKDVEPRPMTASERQINIPSDEPESKEPAATTTLSVHAKVVMHLAHNPPATTDELKAALDVNKNTLRRVLGEGLESGAFKKDDDGKYSLGEVAELCALSA
jgi:Fic family protein